MKKIIQHPLYHCLCHWLLRRSIYNHFRSDRGKGSQWFKDTKEEKLKILNALKAELNQINDAISDLDPSEKLALISIFEVKPENFDHYVEIQANIKTRQNVLLYRIHRYTQKICRGGAGGQKRKTPGANRRCRTQKSIRAIADSNSPVKNNLRAHPKAVGSKHRC